MVKVKIPATTANMGPGFDTLGMALNLYNEIEITEDANVVNSEDNLVYKSMVKAFKACEYKYGNYKIEFTKCDVPMSRGLGSSATCIVGGIMAANAIMGNKLTEEAIINLATEMEGHPDNVVPAIVGGMAVSIYDGEKVVYSKVNVPDNLRFVVIIPDFEVSTSAARKVLPKDYSRNDCVFNVSRAAMLVTALNNGEIDKIRTAFQDKIHEPYRKTLIKNIDEVFLKAKELGSVGEFISGSGSTLIAVIHKDNEKFIIGMKKAFNELQIGWAIKELKTDLVGAKILIES
ncbi:MAG: homoserine kinase [Bacillota bacterium]|nr:homoserine kinase [Bacillota bacterium]